ncbi:MAG: helix-turn-helix transcriptional regulator [Actinomycetes bacterium]
MAKRMWTIRTGGDLGASVAEIRQLSGHTQAQLADEAAISRDYLAKLESGRSTKVLEHLLRLLRRMGATITVSFEESDGTP